MHTNDLFIYLLIANASDASFSMTQLPHAANKAPAPTRHSLHPTIYHLTLYLHYSNTHRNRNKITKKKKKYFYMLFRVRVLFKFIEHLSQQTFMNFSLMNY